MSFPNANHVITVTRWPSVTATAPTGTEQVTWGALADELCSPPEYAAKSDCPLIQLGTIGKRRSPKANSLRHDANIADVSGIVADYDGERVSIDEGAERLQQVGFEAFLYTSPSHTTEKPRWRVVLPLSQPCSPADRYELVSAVNGALGGVLAAESWALSQIYYYGRVAGAEYEFRHVPGGFIDQMAELAVELGELTPIGKPGSASTRDSVAVDALEQEVRRNQVAQADDTTMRDLGSALNWLAAHTDRADDRVLWIEVGHALASLKDSRHAAKALDLWHEFSGTSSKYDALDCDARWEGFSPDRITFRSIFEWAQAAGWTNPGKGPAIDLEAALTTAGPDDRFTRDDVGNAHLMQHLSRGNLRYLPGQKTFLFWDGERWNVDANGVQVHEVARAVSAWHHQRAEQALEAAKAQRPDDIGAANSTKGRGVQHVRWSRTCRGAKSIAAMISLFKTLPGVPVDEAQLNTDPYVLGVQNGAVDLRTGTLRANSRDELATLRCSVAFDPEAKAPTWERFVHEITGLPIAPEFDNAGNVKPDTVGRYTARPELAAYLQRVAGYLATGLTREQVLFFLAGVGSNGKSVFVEALQSVLGDYAAAIPIEVLMSGKYAADGDRATPTLARLIGKRLALTSETKTGHQLDEQAVKRHTGDARMSARRLYGEQVEFTTTHKIVALGNRDPSISELDAAMRGRIQKVQFDRRWNRPGEVDRDAGLPDSNKNLPTALRAEAAGILAWVVRGAVQYLQHGLQPPGEVLATTRMYLDDQDHFRRWLRGYRACPAAQGMTSAQAYTEYCQSLEDAGLNDFAVTLDKRAFGRRLAGAGFPMGRSNSSRLVGMRRTEEVDREDD